NLEGGEPPREVGQSPQLVEARLSYARRTSQRPGTEKATWAVRGEWRNKHPPRQRVPAPGRGRLIDDRGCDALPGGWFGPRKVSISALPLPGKANGHPPARQQGRGRWWREGVPLP